MLTKSLTLRMLLITLVMGLLIWAGLAQIQKIRLSEIFHEKLSDRFAQQARQDRLRFDRYIKAHHKAVTLFAHHQALRDYLDKNSWVLTERRHPVRRQQYPGWLPPTSLTRDFIKLNYALILNDTGKAVEYYQIGDAKIPSELLHLSRLIISLAHDQTYLTTINDQPFLVAAETIRRKSDGKKITLMLATPLDEDFLIFAQGPGSSATIAALLTAEEDSRVIVSSNQQQIPPGESLHDLQTDYLITGLAFFDYGASDITIRFASFISNKEVGELTGTILGNQSTQLAVTSIIFIAVFSLIMIWITQRIQKMSSRVVEFADQMGLNESRIPDSRGDEINRLEKQFNAFSTEIKKETKALEYQATHDPLTDLPNRVVLHKVIARALSNYAEAGTRTALLIMDLDGFKEINDTLGHNIGDLMLVEVGKRIRQELRDDDTVARLGGDEFAVLMNEGTGDEARDIAYRLVRIIEQPFLIEGHRLNVGVSIGIALLPDHGTERNALIQHADVAMYVAKRVKCGFTVYDPLQDRHSLTRLELKSELQQAIENGELELRFQPQVDIKNNTIIGVEALTRWHHPERGIILPAEFIPLAEQTGLITPLTRWLINAAIQQASRWKEKQIDLRISINLSVRCLHEPTLFDNIRRLLEKYGVNPKQLMIEITEDAIMADPDRVKTTLHNLSAIGVLLSIDDFGTGQSSLTYLKTLPVSELKIDKSFVLEMGDDDSDAMIVHATIDLAHNLGLRVVAEGVESEDALNLLKLLHCDMAQGYFIAVALTNEKLLALPEKTGWRFLYDRADPKSLSGGKA